jgi:hypothetical protein
MSSSSNEDEAVAIMYLKKNPDPLLNGRVWPSKSQRRRSTIHLFGKRIIIEATR